MILIKTSYIIIIMRMNICMVINQIIKHKVKISNHYTYIQIIIKTFLLFQYIKNFYFLSNIRMIKPSLHELRLIAQIRNISNNENKSKI